MAEHTTQQPIRVVLVDDHALVRQGFRRILEDDEDITVVGEAGNGLDGLALVKKLEPDVVVMDMAMPEMNGLHASIEMLKQRPASRILIRAFIAPPGHRGRRTRRRAASPPRGPCAPGAPRAR